MRIATSQLYDRPTAQMSSLTAQADRLQTEVSTGKRVITASDDPAAWVRLQGLARADAGDTAWSGNVKLSQGLLAQSDSTLESVQTQLQRAQELTVQAANGTLSDTGRSAIKTELDSIIDELMSLANTTDVRGQPIFGGADGGTPFVKASDGTISYAGTGTPAAIPVGDGSSVTPGVTGDRAFGDMFAMLTAISTALGDGDAPPQSAADGLQSANDEVSAARASVGARAARMDIYAAQLTNTSTTRADERQSLESTDVSAAITELQKTLTILQATQASFTKLSSMSLFDYLK